MVGISGFTRAGDAKVVLLELAARVAREGRPFRIDLWTGASVGDEVDGVLAENGLLRRRLPFQAEGRLRNAINRGEVMFTDQHLGHTAEFLRSGTMGRPDVAIIEAAPWHFLAVGQGFNLNNLVGFGWSEDLIDTMIDHLFRSIASIPST